MKIKAPDTLKTRRGAKPAVAGSEPVKTSREMINPLTHPDAAGIDVGSAEFVAAVPRGRDAGTCVQTFRTFTSGVEALCGWLLRCGIRTVAMESTGNFWITLYDGLEQAGIEVYLVNARHVKGVPGRKTDVCDAQWLQQLHAAGLLKKSFRPDQQIVPVRYLMRHRSGMVEEAGRQLQLMQKTLTEPERSGDSQPDCLKRKRALEKQRASWRQPINWHAFFTA